MDTIKNIKGDKGYKETVLPWIENLLKENKDMMPNELPKHYLLCMR